MDAKSINNRIYYFVSDRDKRKCKKIMKTFIIKKKFFVRESLDSWKSSNDWTVQLVHYSE